VQESERRLLATELHDRVGQNLTALGINLSIVAGACPRGEAELGARLQDCNALVEGTVDAMRDVMAELRPHALDDYGLPAALRSLATGFSRRTGIHVDFEKEGAGRICPSRSISRCSASRRRHSTTSPSTPTRSASRSR